MQSAILRRRKRSTTRFALPRSTKVAIRPLSSNSPSHHLFHGAAMRRHSSSPSRSRKPVLLARAPTYRAITATCFTQSPDLFARAPKGGRKIGNLLCKQGNFHSETPNFSPNRATYSGIARLFCGMTRLLLRFLVSFPPVHSNASSPFLHSSLVTSSPLCLPSVNSLSTTIAAP